MNQRIIFQTESASVSVLSPCVCGLTILEIGKKDVPAGVPFWVVDASQIPTDRTYRDAWELDSSAMGEPSGFGGGKA